MDDATLRRRVAAARVGRLATVTPEGTPHLVPCCFVLDGDTVYSAVDGKPKSTLALRRLANVRARPAASLLVDHYEDDWSALWWIRLDGTARVLEPPAPGPADGARPGDSGPDDRHGPGSADAVPIGPEHAHALDLLAAKYAQYREQRPPGAVLALDVAAWRAWAP